MRRACRANQPRAAVRILARQGNHFPSQGHLLSLYSYLFTQHKSLPEVEAECFRYLAQAPAGAVSSVLSHYTALISSGTGMAVPRHETKDDVALLGLLDLVMASPDNGHCFAFLERFLRETQRYEVYHSVLTAIVATHSSQFWKVLLEVTLEERMPEKIDLLLQHDPKLEQVKRELQQKKAEADRGRSAI